MAESTVVHAEEREITITRVFSAPRELVFQAWTDPDHLARWFGPAGFEIPRDSVSIEARVGGRPLYLTAAALPGGRFIVVARSPVTRLGSAKSNRVSESASWSRTTGR